MAQSSYVGQPTAIPGKMLFAFTPTPLVEDRIYLLRRDTRKPDYREPTKGDPYTGPNAEKFEGFFYCAWRKTDQLGWIDEIYVNERANQDAYNGEITYPYVDKDYPMVTRTYVVLRGDQRAAEPQADAVDSVFTDLKLTDHKIYRVNTGQYDFLDDMFVGIQRIYERLPGPVIRTYDVNSFQQVVNVDTQTVETEAIPTPDATTEIDKTARTGTAKAQVVLGTVDSVFPNTKYTTDRTEHIIPFKFRSKVPSQLVQQTFAGDAAQPVLAQAEWTGDDTQITEFKHTTARTVHNIGEGVATLEYKLTNDQQLSTIVDTWQPNGQTLTPVALLIEGEVIELGNGDTIKSLTTIPNVFGATAYQIEIPDPIPERFRVAVPVTETTVTSIGTAVPPTLGTGDLEIKDEQKTVFWHRLSTRHRDTTITAVLVSYKMTEDQQIETITETLATGLQTIAPDEFTVEADTQNLGNNTSLKKVGLVPEVFGATSYQTEIPDPIPERFRVAVPLYETIQTGTGEASFTPALATGELLHREEQRTEFIFRQTVHARNPSFTATLVSYKMTQERQVEVITETLATGLQNINDIDEFTVEAAVQNLGNNTSLKTLGAVDEVFGATASAKSIPDLIPVEFRPFVPTVTRSVLQAGTITDPPVLATGELSRKEEQEDEFRFRRMTESRAGVVLPISHTNTELTTEFGGGILNVVLTLAAQGSSTIDQGLLVLKSSIKDLGNGQELKETDELSVGNWPELPSRLWDANMRVEYDQTQQVVDLGTPEDTAPGGTWGWVSEVKAIDAWRSQKVNSSKPASVYAAEASALISYAYKPYRFPGLLYYSGTGYYVRHADASLVQHRIKTWWEKSSTAPEPVIDDIIMDDVVINNLGLTGLTYSGPVLHDDVQSGIISYPATTPSYTQYALGTPTGGSTQHNIGSLYTPGNTGGYIVGDVIFLNSGGFAMSVTVTFVYDVPDGPSGLIGATTADDPSGTFPTGTYGPIAASGGSGSGAYFNVWSVAFPNYTPGSGWIGTWRVIGAEVTLEREKDIWKIVTESVIMR